MDTKLILNEEEKKTKRRSKWYTKQEIKKIRI